MSPASIPEYTGKEWQVKPLDLSFEEAVKRTARPVKDKNSTEIKRKVKLPTDQRPEKEREQL